MIKEKLKLHCIGGSSFVQHKPVFSADGQFIFLASSTSLYSYTTKTGKRFLEFKGIKDRIAHFGVFTDDRIESIVACTVTGSVITWQIANGVKTKQTDLGLQNVEYFKLFPNVAGRCKAFISWLNIEHLNFGIVSIAESFNFEQLPFELPHHDNHKIGFGGNGRDAFVCQANGKKLSIIRLSEPTNIVRIKINGRKITCVACHDEHTMILTGDDSGRVILWRDVFNARIQTVFHWHTLPVESVCFSSSSTTFLSGGSECVLVKWTVDNTNQKQFLPRLSNCIQQLAVAPQNQFVAIATKDNAIHIVDMQWNVVSIINELVFGDNFTAGMHVDPKTNSLVLNGNLGHLQFYLPQEKQLLYSLDVVGMNRITNERGTIMQNTEVTAMDFSRSGLWMATIECRSSDVKFFENRLKIWNFNDIKQSFQLNTNVEYPHEKRVSGLKFQPSSNETDLRLITIGEDALFKVWQLTDVTSVYTKGAAWRCASSGDYRGLIPTSIAFSFDGSLVAIGFDNILTTWIPDTCAIKCSLLHSNYNETIKQIAFGSGTQCHLVVVAGKSRLSVWNLLTLSLMWTVSLNVVHLVSDPFTMHMAVLTDDNSLYVFEPMNESPFYVHESLVDDGSILAAAFIRLEFAKDNCRSWNNKTQLFIVDVRKQLFCLDDAEMMEHDAHQMRLELNETRSVFSAMIPHKTNRVENPNYLHKFASDKSAKKKLADLLEAPIHTMMPTRMTAFSIISSLIYKQNQSDKDDEEKNVQNMQSPAIVQTDSVSQNCEQLAEDLSKIMREKVTWTSVLT